jgi:hypothetical protein
VLKSENRKIRIFRCLDIHIILVAHRKTEKENVENKNIENENNTKVDS